MDTNVITSWKKKIKLILTVFKSFCQEDGGTNKCTYFPVSSPGLLFRCDKGARPFQCQFERDPVLALSCLYVL